MSKSFFRKAVIGAIILSGLVFAAGLNAHWRFQRDGALYLDLARSLVEGRGYVHNYQPHGKAAPGLPLMLAGVESMTSVPETLDSNFFYLNLMESVFGLGCVLVACLIMKKLGLKPVQFLAVLLLFALSRTLHYYSSHIITDVPFTFFALLALYLGLHMHSGSGSTSWGWCAGAAVPVALASALRPIGPFLVFSLLLGLWMKRGALQEWKTNLQKSTFMLLLVAVPVGSWAGWTYLLAPEDARASYFRGLLRSFPQRMQQGFMSPFTKYAEHASGISDAVCGSELGTRVGSVLILFMVLGLVEAVRRREVVLSSYAFVSFYIIMAGGWALDRRYLLPMLPIMLIWAAWGARRLGHVLRTWTDFWNKHRVRKAGLVCLGLLLAVNVLRIGKLVYQNRHPRFYQVEDNALLSDYDGIVRWLRRNAAPQDTVAGYEHRLVHYFSRVRTYHLPDAARNWNLDRVKKHIRRHNIHYIVEDERQPGSTAFMEDLQKAEGIAAERVKTDGRVRLVRIQLPDD